MCEKGSSEKNTGSLRYCRLSKPQDMLMYVLSLTVDEVGDSVVFPIPRWEADPWGRCISGTTGMLSEAQRTSLTSAPTESAAGGLLPQHTAHIHIADVMKYGAHVWHSTGLNLAFTPTWTWSHQFSSVMLFFKRKENNRITDENEQDFGSQVHHSS